MKTFARRVGMGLLGFAFAGGTVSAQGWQHLGRVQSVEKLKDGVELTAGAANVRLTVFREGVFRVRVAPNGTFPKDFSWAVIESPEAPALTVEEDQKEVRISAGNTVAIVHKSPLLINFSDTAGNVLLADEQSLPMAWNGQRVHAWKKMPSEENYYGLGDKAGPMNRRNRAFTNWNTDAFGWQESTDPLYKTIPFFIGLRKGLAYGLFFDNTYRSSFDFGKESADYFSFGAEGGELNYYFTPGSCAKREFLPIPSTSILTIRKATPRSRSIASIFRILKKWSLTCEKKVFTSSPSRISTSRDFQITTIPHSIREQKMTCSSRIRTAPSTLAPCGRKKAFSLISP